MQTQKYNLILPGKGKGNGTKGMVAFLAVELFCPENMSIRKFEAIDDETDACTEISYEILFIDAVTVCKGITVQKNVPQHCSTAYSGKCI